jgi:hypothetical protein
MSGLLRIGAQFGVILALFASVVAFADWPRYRQTPHDTGLVVLTFVHGASRDAECRRLSPQEIARLPPNMRRTHECPRGRRPIYVELNVRDKTVYRAFLPPTGLAGDGPSRVYRRFVLPVGEHNISVRMRDTARSQGFDHERSELIKLGPDQMFAIDFRPNGGGFIFR